MLTKEKTAAIRQKLKKEYGYTGRQVSVRAENYSLGSSINVTIKDETVNYQAVKDAAEDHEKIRRCEITHEILGGGNTYVHVEYDHDLVRAKADSLREMVEEVAANDSQKLGDTGYILMTNGHGVGNYEIVKYDGDIGTTVASAYDLAGVAEILARLILKEV